MPITDADSLLQATANIRLEGLSMSEEMQRELDQAKSGSMTSDDLLNIIRARYTVSAVS